jgi:SPP1 gp7 family putative phage head morphogenesis protein
LKAVRQRFRELRGAVRRVAGYDEDRFHLADDARLADADDIERFPTDAGKTRAFIAWLRERFAEGVLEVTEREAVRNGEHWTATYIRAAYQQGWENATQRLQNAGVGTESVEAVFQLGVPQRQLRRLYTRTFENLQSVAEDVAPVVRETLTDGLAEGVNPREMARRLTKEVRTIQRTQAEVLARTEVINSYAEATLDRYERGGVEGVTVSGEFATADDDRVCPICEAIEGAEFATDAMRTATFEFEAGDDEPDSLGGEYPVKPPVHPQCRCAILPVVG